MNTFERSNKNIFGKYFIFFKFLRVLIKMSQITFERIFDINNKSKNNGSDENINKIKPEEMFILLLQKLEQSEGFTNFTKINNVTHNYKTTTIIPMNFTFKFEMMNDEKGDTNFISVLIILGIVVVLAGVFMGFKDQIVKQVNDLMKNFKIK